MNKTHKVTVGEERIYITTHESNILEKDLSNKLLERVKVRGGLYVKKDIGSISLLTKEEFRIQNRKITAVSQMISAGDDEDIQKAKKANMAVNLFFEASSEERENIFQKMVEEHGYYTLTIEMMKYARDLVEPNMPMGEFQRRVKESITTSNQDQVRAYFIKFDPSKFLEDSE